MKKLAVFISAIFETVGSIGVSILGGSPVSVSYLIGNATLLSTA